jgi:hypothetical protein
VVTARKLSPVERRIVRRLKAHLAQYGGTATDRDGSGDGDAGAVGWHRGWRCGFRAALAMIAMATAGETATERRERVRGIRKWIRARRAEARVARSPKGGRP